MSLIQARPVEWGSGSHHPVVCAWCGEFVGESHVCGSHGICANCAGGLLRQMAGDFGRPAPAAQRLAARGGQGGPR